MISFPEYRAVVWDNLRGTGTPKPSDRELRDFRADGVAPEKVVAMLVRSHRNRLRGGDEDNPVGDFITEHPWMTFFLGLATLNTVGLVAIAGVMAAQSASTAAAASAAPPTPTSGAPVIPLYSAANAQPVVIGQPLSAAPGSSVLVTDASSEPVVATSSNPNVLAPAFPSVTGAFVAVAPGTATVTSGSSSSVVTVTAAASSSGTSGVGRPAAVLRRPPLSMLFGIMPRRALPA